MRTLEDSVDENAGGVNLIRRKLAGFDEFFDFGDDVVGGGSHHGIEVARSLAINEIAPAIAFPRLDEGEIAAEAALHDVRAAIEFAGFLSFSNHGAVAGGGIERGNASAAGAQALGESALRIQFNLEFSAQDELLEEFVLADVGGDHFFDLALLEKQADAEVVYARVVAHDGELFCAFAANGGDEIFRDAAEAEAAHENGRAVGELFDGGVGGSDAFIHSMLRSDRGSLLHPALEPEDTTGSVAVIELGAPRGSGSIPPPGCFGQRVWNCMKTKGLIF